MTDPAKSPEPLGPLEEYASEAAQNLTGDEPTVTEVEVCVPADVPSDQAVNYVRQQALTIIRLDMAGQLTVMIVEFACGGHAQLSLRTPPPDEALPTSVDDLPPDAQHCKCGKPAATIRVATDREHAEYILTTLQTLSML